MSTVFHTKRNTSFRGPFAQSKSVRTLPSNKTPYHTNTRPFHVYAQPHSIREMEGELRFLEVLHDGDAFVDYALEHSVFVLAG